MKNKGLLIILLTLILTLSSCSSGESALNTAPTGYENSSEASVSENMEAENESAGEEESLDESSSVETGEDVEVSQNLQLVTTYNYDVSTRKFEDSLAAVKTFVSENGGYIVSEDTSYGNGYTYSRFQATIRLSKEQSSRLEEMLNSNEELFRVESQNKNTDEVSKEYFDSEVRLGVLEQRVARLQEISQTQSDITQLLEVEREISSTISEIEDIKGSLRYLDDQIAMDTINLSIREELISGVAAQQDRSPSFATRVKDRLYSTWIGFVDFIQNLILLLISLLPYIILLGLIVVLVRRLTKNRKFKLLNIFKRKNKKMVNCKMKMN